MRAEMAAAAMEVAAEDADAALKAAITREAVTKVVVPEFEFVDSDEDVDAMEEDSSGTPRAIRDGSDAPRTPEKSAKESSPPIEDVAFTRPGGWIPIAPPRSLYG